MAERPQVAALLLNWRHADLTQRCLGDLLQVDGVDLHVLVMDNGSGDGSEPALVAAAAAARAAGHRVEFRAFGENLGFTGAMNRGIEWAGERGLPLVLVLNNDLRLPSDFLLPLCTVLRQDPRVVAVGPTVLRPDGRVWAEGGTVAFGANGLRLRNQGRLPASRRHGPEAVDFVPGACVLFRTAELQAVGGFDDAYFMYWEDVDLCRRLCRRGGRCLWLPWVQVTHAAGQSSGGGRSPLRKFLMACNSVRYARTHGGVGTWAALWLCDVVLLPLALLTGWRAGIAKLRGLWAGFRGHRASARDVARWFPGPPGGDPGGRTARV